MTVEDVENLVIGVTSKSTIYLKQVAEVFDGPWNTINVCAN